MRKKLLALSLLFFVQACSGQSDSAPQTLGDRIGSALEKAAKATGAIKDYGPARIVPKGASPSVVLKEGKILFNGKPLAIGGNLEEWKKVIGKGAVCSTGSETPKWCKWDVLGLSIGTQLGNVNKVKYLAISFNVAPADDFAEFQEIASDGRRIKPKWLVTGVFPGYLELDGFGIDKSTKFWEIRKSADRKHDLRCGLRDCRQPHGGFNEISSLYLVLNRNDEYGELKSFTVSGDEEQR
jgi:hypothetical protein